MQKNSLPAVLQFALKQHVSAADIDDDDELHTIMQNLSELHEKVELVKLKARAKRLLRE